MQQQVTRKLRYNLLVLFVIGFVIQSLPAQEFRNVEFRAFNLRPGNFSEIYFHDTKNKITPIEFKKKSRTDSLNGRVNIENNLLHFYLPNKSTNPLDASEPTLAASVWINPNWQAPLLIFSEQSTGDEPRYSLIAIEDSFQRFPIGRVKIVNLTGANVIGSIDGEITKLQSHTASQDFDLPSNGRIEVAIAAQAQTRHHLLYKNTLSLNKKTRSLLILRPPKRTGSIKIQGQLLIEYDPEDQE
ncbi:hypothetical protein ACWPKS_14530 [Coraliomargarita sp. W4R72]